MPPHPIVRFFLELKRRRVIRVAIGYAVAAGALMQSVSVIFPALHFPEWTTTFVVVLCLVGFPVALVLAWAFDLTPHGVRGALAAEDYAGARPSGLARYGLAVALAVLVIGAVGTTAFFALRQRHGAVATREAPVRLAVLYFDDRTPDGSLQYLADGITEELIDKLSAIPALSVVSRNGVAPFRGDSVPVDSIARALRASVLVSGTVARSGNVVRVRAELSDSTGTVLHSTTIDHPWSESFALVDDVVHQVSTALRTAAGNEVEVKRWRAGTQSEEAWRRLQLARSQLEDMQQMVAAGEVAAGIRLLEGADTVLAGAERLDPRWVEPVVQRAWNSAHLSLMAKLLPDGDAGSRAALKRALVHAGRAVTLAPGNGRALEVRSWVRYRAARELPLAPDSVAALARLAQEDAGAAVAADPLRARAWVVLARSLLAQARFAEARVAAEHAYDADAYLTDAPDIVRTLFQSALELGDDAEARRWCAENRRLLATGRLEGSWNTAYCSLELLAWGEPPPPHNVDPWPIVEEARGDPPPVAAVVRPRLEMLAAAVLARTGRADSALGTAARARKAAPSDPAVDYLDAAVHVQLGDAAGALSRLRAFARRDLPGSRQLLEGRMFRPLRGDTAYQAVLRGSR